MVFWSANSPDSSIWNKLAVVFKIIVTDSFDSLISQAFGPGDRGDGAVTLASLSSLNTKSAVYYSSLNLVDDLRLCFPHGPLLFLFIWSEALPMPPLLNDLLIHELPRFLQLYFPRFLDLLPAQLNMPLLQAHVIVQQLMRDACNLSNPALIVQFTSPICCHIYCALSGTLICFNDLF